MFFKHLESNSAFSLLDANNFNINKGIGIKPTYLQYDFEKLKINNPNAQFININNNSNINNISLKYKERDFSKSINKSSNENLKKDNIKKILILIILIIIK